MCPPDRRQIGAQRSVAPVGAALHAAGEGVQSNACDQHGRWDFDALRIGEQFQHHDANVRLPGIAPPTVRTESNRQPREANCRPPGGWTSK
jgi:hypothetical protein